MMIRIYIGFILFLVLTIDLFITSIYAQSLRQLEKKETPPLASCKQFVPPLQEIQGQAVGIDDCQIISQEIVFNAQGHRIVRIEIVLGGIEDGWAIKDSNALFHNYFTDAPDFVHAQLHLQTPARALAHYKESSGHGISLFIPQDIANWNGKLFVTVHGSISYARVGTLLPRDSRQKFNPYANTNKYVGMMIDKGYAVAHTMRNAAHSAPEADVNITFDDGTVVEDGNLAFHAGIIKTWTVLAENLISQKFNQPPSRTYFYGFSAGGMLGKLINYKPGHNRHPDGSPLFDGFIQDDSSFWLPKLMDDGHDVLFQNQAQRNIFSKQIDIGHQLTTGAARGMDNLRLKRSSAQILKSKGLADKHRYYEIRGVAHFDAGYGPEDLGRGRDSIHQSLDLGTVMDAFIDRLDEWIERDIEPPPIKTDDKNLGDINGDGINENPAIALPEIACPLGIYYGFPYALGPTVLGDNTTSFAAFDGINQEPIDGKGDFVDMNENGSHDQRETVTQAWHRLGLLKSGKTFNRRTYIACVKSSTSKLVEARLLSKKVEDYYIEQAKTSVLPRFAANRN